MKHFITLVSVKIGLRADRLEVFTCSVKGGTHLIGNIIVRSRRVYICNKHKSSFSLKDFLLIRILLNGKPKT